jgi:hypothetical protein
VSDSDVNIDDDGWTNNDDLRNLEQFLGNSDLTSTPDDPTSISKAVNRFLGNDFSLNSCRAIKFICAMLKMQTNTKIPQCFCIERT